MPLTLDTVRANMYKGDPIAPSPAFVTDHGGSIEIRGVDDGGVFMDELRMVQIGDGVELYTRDPGQTTWKYNCLFQDWRELHTWIYEL